MFMGIAQLLNKVLNSIIANQNSKHFHGAHSPNVLLIIKQLN